MSRVADRFRGKVLGNKFTPLSDVPVYAGRVITPLRRIKRLLNSDDDLYECEDDLGGGKFEVRAWWLRRYCVMVDTDV